MSIYDLAYKGITELETDASAAASGDYMVRYDASTDSVVKIDATSLIGITGLTASAAEINAVADVSGRIVNTTANLTLTAASHGDRIVTVDKADGAAIVLPAASGSGNVYKIIIGTAVTSNTTTIKVANTSDSFYGMALGVDTAGEGATGFTWNADSGDDTITMDGSTTGGKAGDYWEIVDFAANKFLVRGFISQSGTDATPFSATVS